MTKILQVVPDLAYGGVEKVVINYYAHLDKDNFSFDFITHGKFYPYHDKIIKTGCHIYYFDTLGKLGIKKYLQQIINNIDIVNYDIVHIHTGDITGIYAKAFKKVGAKKIICHSHTAHPVTKKRRLFNWFLKAMANKYSDGNLSCGELAGNYCFGKNKYVVLPNAIELTLFVHENKIVSDKLRTELNLNQSNIVIGHVGNYLPVKNHNFILDLFSSLKKINDNYRLVLVGFDTDCDELKHKIVKAGLEKYVIPLGVRDDVNALLHIFNLFVLPSFFEGLPVVGIEAQAAGLRCIFSDTIDKTVDVGAELVSFLPINQGTDVWVQTIEQLIKCNKTVSESRIKDLMIANKFEIEASVKELENYYKLILN